LRRFRSGSRTADDHFPEDWLASTVLARNGSNSQSREEGLSRLGEPFSGQKLTDALRAAPEFWFGGCQQRRESPGVLWKLLDSSVRLQLQAHPDRAFARKHLNSTAGKTECWYILETRGDGCVYLGFQRSPGRDEWGRMIREQRVDEMLACFDPLPVRAGECYAVPAGTPHAIGAGVFMVELMEPTDWVVRCETTNAGVALSPEACFMGLGLDTCLEIFNYNSFPPSEVRNRYQQRPRTVNQQAGFVREEIIGPDWHEFFQLHRLRGDGTAEWPGGGLMLLIALKGSGRLATKSESQLVSAGQTWLLPGAADNWEWHSEGDWELLLAMPPSGTG